MIFAALLLLVSAGADALLVIGKSVLAPIPQGPWKMRKRFEGGVKDRDYLEDQLQDNTHAGISDWLSKRSKKSTMWGALKSTVDAAKEYSKTEGASFFENWNNELPDQQDPANKMLNTKLSNIGYYDGDYDRLHAMAETGEDLTWHGNLKYQSKLPKIEGNKGNRIVDQQDRSSLNGKPASYWWPGTVAAPLDPNAVMGRRNPDSRSGLPPALQIPARASSMGALTKTGDNSGTRGMLPLDLELAAEANEKAGSGITMAQAYRDVQKDYVAKLHGGANGLENGKPVYRTSANVYADQSVDSMLNRLRRTVDEQKKEITAATG